MDISTEIREKLDSLADKEYAAFQKKIIPDIDGEKIIGVRTPMLRTLAKEYSKRDDIEEFLSFLPPASFDEMTLMGLIIEKEKDFGKCIEMLRRFLPYVDNWASCDVISPKVFAKNKEKLLPIMLEFTESRDVYVCRFGIEMLMTHFLGENYLPVAAEAVAKIKREEYYVKMMVAWYFATALAKNWEEIIPFIENNQLGIWEHNKTIRKAIESYRITDGQKAYLRTLKRSD